MGPLSTDASATAKRKKLSSAATKGSERRSLPSKSLPKKSKKRRNLRKSESKRRQGRQLGGMATVVTTAETTVGTIEGMTVGRAATMKVKSTAVIVGTMIGIITVEGTPEEM